MNNHMEQITNFLWYFCNATLLVVTRLAEMTEILKFIVLILTVVSTIVFIGFNISKWYDQILKTKIFKKENNI